MLASDSEVSVKGDVMLLRLLRQKTISLIVRRTVSELLICKVLHKGFELWVDYAYGESVYTKRHAVCQSTCLCAGSKVQVHQATVQVLLHESGSCSS